MLWLSQFVFAVTIAFLIYMQCTKRIHVELWLD